MDYKETFNSLMNDVQERNTATTVYEDYKMTVSKENLQVADLLIEERIFVFVNNNQNAIYLTNKNNLGDGFGIAKIVKHTPMMGLRLNVGKILNIGKVPAEMVVETEKGLIKIYPVGGLERVPANKAYDAVADLIMKLYDCSVDEWVKRYQEGMLK